MNLKGALLTFWPLLLLQILLAAFGIIDLIRRKEAKHLSKGIWAIIIIFINFVGPILYLTLGRGEE